MTEPMETHDIAVTVIVRTDAVDHSDATSVAEAVVSLVMRQHMDQEGMITVPNHRSRGDQKLTARLLKIISVDRAARGGYVKVVPTFLAASEWGFGHD